MMPTNFDVHVFRTREDLWCARIEGLARGRFYTQRRMSLKHVLLEAEEIILLDRKNAAAAVAPLDSYDISGSPELDPRTERGLR